MCHHSKATTEAQNLQRQSRMGHPGHPPQSHSTGTRVAGKAVNYDLHSNVAKKTSYGISIPPANLECRAFQYCRKYLLGLLCNCVALIPSFATDWNKCLLQQVHSHIKTWGLPTTGKLFVKMILTNLTDPSASSVLPGSRHLFFTPILTSSKAASCHLPAEPRAEQWHSPWDQIHLFTSSSPQNAVREKLQKKKDTATFLIVY